MEKFTRITICRQYTQEELQHENLKQKNCDLEESLRRAGKSICDEDTLNLPAVAEFFSRIDILFTIRNFTRYS